MRADTFIDSIFTLDTFKNRTGYFLEHHRPIHASCVRLVSIRFLRFENPFANSFANEWLSAFLNRKSQVFSYSLAGLQR